MALLDRDALDPARTVMYDRVADVVGDDALEAALDDVIRDQLEGMYDQPDEDLRANFIQAGYMEAGDE